jgi:hypothetical protein
VTALALVVTLAMPNMTYGDQAVTASCSASDIPCLITETWPEQEWDHVAQVVACESRGHPNAIGENGTSRVFGLMQIDAWSWKRWLTERGINWDRWMDPAINLKAGYLIWSEYGWSGWACSRPEWRHPR